MRPRSSGRPSRSTTGCGLTPAVHTTVRVGIVWPSERRALVAVTSSSVVCRRRSMPRMRSSAMQNSARSGAVSRMMRSAASTRIQRMPCVRQRG